MKPRKIPEKYRRVLKRIQDNVPQELLDKVTKKQYSYGTMRKVINKALTDDNPEVQKLLTPEKREQLERIKRSGILDKKEDVVNESVEDKLDAYYKTEIDKAVDRGELPKRMHSSNQKEDDKKED